MTKIQNGMKRGAVLFDLDYTLWDHPRVQRETIRRICSEYNFDFDAFYPHYVHYNWEGWQAFAQGKLGVDEMRVGRFVKALKAVRITHLSPHQLSEDYLNWYRGGVYLMDGAEKLLNALRPHYVLGIITNGTMDTQIRKLDNSILKDYMAFMITVDEAGCSKPNAAYFELAFRKSGFAPEKITCVGDNYIDDIVGSVQAGVGCAIWYNPDDETLPIGLRERPHHIVRHLTEIIPILLNHKSHMSHKNQAPYPLP